ncbi:MAG: hypothetical protein ACRDV2_13040, partial [Actinomycetes bacterium]
MPRPFSYRRLHSHIGKVEKLCYPRWAGKVGPQHDSRVKGSSVVGEREHAAVVDEVEVCCVDDELAIGGPDIDPSQS